MPIQVLPPQLANQIAAGEVVERPASVVKELVENSLDAGASRIDIDIERGGAKLIRIRDNGCGIKKEELALALARHATSKIACLDDLEAIVSLGFRGEALASISSVSRLTLTSRPAEQKEAWQAYAEGREMTVDVKPAAHPVGSTIEVLDLFYNTPARRKFLRTEKTEFNHIDEVVRRIALARFDVAINLQHNGKLIRQYRPVKEESQREKRLASICGPTFIRHAVKVSWQHGDLSIHGWITTPEGANQPGELQYSYVNGRMIRDRLINHAIRQGYQAELNNDCQPAYVLYIDVDPHQVDVNVHPAKHEVRFHQSRLVHDFIYQAVASALQQIKNSPLPLSDPEQNSQTPLSEPNATSAIETRVAAGKNSFSEPANCRSDNGDSASRAGFSAGKGQGSGSSWHERYSPVKGAEKRFAQESQLYGQLIHGEEEEFTLQADKPNLATVQNQPAKPELFPKKPNNSNIMARSACDGPIKIGRILSVWRDFYAVVEYQSGLGLLSLNVAENCVRAAQLRPQTDGLKAQPLLIPLRLRLSESEKQGYSKHQSLLARLGIDVTLSKERAEIKAVPLPLRQQNLQVLLPEMLGYLSGCDEISSDRLIDWLAARLGSERERWNQSQAVQIVGELERLCPEALLQPMSKLIQPIDLNGALLALEDE